MSALGSIFKCYTTLGKNQSVGPPVTLIKKCPWAMDRRWHLCRPVDTNEKALLLVEVYGCLWILMDSHWSFLRALALIDS